MLGAYQQVRWDNLHAKTKRWTYFAEKGSKTYWKKLHYHNSFYFVCWRARRERKQKAVWKKFRRIYAPLHPSKQCTALGTPDNQKMVNCSSQRESEPIGRKYHSVSPTRRINPSNRRIQQMGWPDCFRGMQFGTISSTTTRLSDGPWRVQMQRESSFREMTKSTKTLYFRSRSQGIIWLIQPQQLKILFQLKVVLPLNDSNVSLLTAQIPQTDYPLQIILTVSDRLLVVTSKCHTVMQEQISDIDFRYVVCCPKNVVYQDTHPTNQLGITSSFLWEYPSVIWQSSSSILQRLEASGIAD